LRIGIAFDLAPAERPASGPDDRYEEFDKPETIEAIAAVLRAEGHEVAFLGDGPELISAVLADRPDFVWNLAEGQGVGRCRESRVPAFLEMLGISYLGSDPLTLAAALDKDVARRLVGDDVGVPAGCCFPADADPLVVASTLARVLKRDSAVGPFILKPAYEGSSKGIRSDCLAETPVEAAERFECLARDYEQPVLVEEFIAGHEVTVGIIGNGPSAEVIGTMRVRPKVPDDRFVYSIDVKRNWERLVDYEVPADLSSSARLRIEKAALAAFHALGCRDLARIDFRVRDDVPYFIEINPLPGLAPRTSDLVILADRKGFNHAELIRRILHVSLVRVGLAQPLSVGL
jgi:D-alanine-D-alanine ligase